VLPTTNTTSRVHGRVVMPQGALPEGLSLSLHRESGKNPLHTETVFVTHDATSGTFHCDELPAGRYHLRAAVMQPFANLAERTIEVSASQTIDLGTIELGSGELLVDVRMAGGEPGHVYAAVQRSGLDFFSGAPREAVAECPIRRQHLTPGTYRVRVWGEQVLPVFADAVIAIGQVTPLAIDVQPGVRTEVRLPGSIGTMTIHFPDGSVVREMVFELRSWVRGLATGKYRVEVTDFSGELHEADFDVGTTPSAAVVLRLASRR
jgi:hypothetical protein